MKTPIITLCTLVTIIKETTNLILVHCYRQSVKIIFGILALSAFALLDGPHTAYRQELYDFTIFAAYWILLGVASSIGLGTGLHTFVLYLGPHIARVTLAAN